MADPGRAVVFVDLENFHYLDMQYVNELAPFFADFTAIEHRYIIGGDLQTERYAECIARFEAQGWKMYRSSSGRWRQNSDHFISFVMGAVINDLKPELVVFVSSDAQLIGDVCFAIKYISGERISTHVHVHHKGLKNNWLPIDNPHVDAAFDYFTRRQIRRDGSAPPPLQ
jgi:hypothetical protein